MGTGVIYPQTVSYPAVELGLASPNAPSSPPMAIDNSVNWASAMGQRQTLYAAPAKWMLLQVVNSGTWAVVSAGPVFPDYRSAAESAYSPWVLSAVDATGHGTLLARSSGGATMNPPPMVALWGDTVLWTTPFVSVSGGALVSEANLASGARRSVRVAVPDGDVVYGLVATPAGEDGWPTPVITAAAAGSRGNVFCDGNPSLPPSLRALMGLPDGRVLLAAPQALYAGQVCGSWSKLAALEGSPGRTWTGPGGSTWVDEGAAKVPAVLQLGSTGAPQALYLVPTGLHLSGDGRGLAWYDVARSSTGGAELSIWWASGASGAGRGS